MSMEWGNRHFAQDGVRVRLTDCATGDPVDLGLIDRRTGLPIGDRHAAVRVDGGRA